MIIALACFYAFVGANVLSKGYLSDLRDDFANLWGEAVLWPLYLLRWLVVQSVRASKNLFAPLG
jgi:hypothetical protein